MKKMPSQLAKFRACTRAPTVVITGDCAWSRLRLRRDPDCALRRDSGRAL